MLFFVIYYFYIINITFKGCDKLSTVKSILEVVTALAAVGATFAAWRSADTSSKQLNTQIEQQSKISRPRLVPLNTVIHTKIVTVLDDWVPKNEEIAVKEQEPLFLSQNHSFSTFPIDVVNMGTSFAINVSYHYELEGGMDALEEYDYKGKKLLFDDSSMIQLNPIDFDMILSQDYKGNLREPTFKFITLRIRRIKRFISYIKGGEKSSFLIPTYFVAVSNLFLKHRNGDPNEKIIKRPKLVLKISYEDQYNEKYTDTYKMQLAKAPLRRAGFEREEVYAWIFFEFVEPLNEV